MKLLVDFELISERVLGLMVGIKLIVRLGAKVRDEIIGLEARVGDEIMMV